MKLKPSIAALFISMALPATAQSVASVPAGCEGLALGTVLADGTVCTETGTGTLGTNITPLMGSDDDSDGESEETEPENSSTHTTSHSTDHDSSNGNDDNGSDHDNGHDDHGSDHDNDND